MAKYGFTCLRIPSRAAFHCEKKRPKTLCRRQIAKQKNNTSSNVFYFFCRAAALLLRRLGGLGSQKSAQSHFHACFPTFSDKCVVFHAYSICLPGKSCSRRRRRERETLSLFNFDESRLSRQSRWMIFLHLPTSISLTEESLSFRFEFRR